MATRWSSEVHVVHVTAIRTAHMVESVTKSPGNVAVSQASEAELVTSVSRDTQSLTASANVRVNCAMSESLILLECA